MPDVHDQALEWAQSNPQDPRAQDIMAKAWASKNPQDPRSSQILAKFQNQAAVQGSPKLSEDDYTKPGEAIPKDAGLMQFFRYSASHFNPGSPESLLGAAGASSPMVVGKAMEGIAQPVSNAARRSGILDKVKDVKNLGPYVASKIGEAKEMFNKKQISPRVLEQRSRAAEQMIKLDPKELQGIHPDVDKMLEGAQQNIPMNQALDIRSKLNEVSKFKPGMVYDAATEARNQKAFDAGGKIRSAIADADPNMRQLSSELHDAYSLRDDVLGSAGDKPISAITNGPLDKQSKLAQFDEQAGSNLSQLGQDIDLANNRLGNKTSSASGIPKSMQGLAHKVLGYAPRMGGAIAQQIDPATQALKNNPKLMSTYIGILQKQNQED